MHLITWLGTVVCQDPATRQLVHRPLSEFADPDLVNLLDAGLRSSGPGSGGQQGRTVPVTIGPPDQKSGVTVHDGTNYLCAEPNGSAAFSRGSASRWETLYPVDRPDLERLRFIAANRWTDVSSGEVVTASMASDFRLRLGRKFFPLSDNSPLPFASAAQNSACPHRFSLYRDGWKLDEYSLFKPLVYFVAFKSDEIFSMLGLALQSLAGLGNYGGDVLIIGDRTQAQLAPLIPSGLSSRVHVLCREATSKLDLYAGRYRVADWPDAVAYQPLLYLDGDVLVDRPLESLLSRLNLSRDLEAQQELFSPLGFAGSVGASLLSADGIDVDGRFGWNSGVFGIPNLRDHGETLRKMISTMERVQAAGPNLPGWNDQPVANYVGVKTRTVQVDLLTPAVRYTRYMRIHGGDQERGFVHFWGSGKGPERIAAMQAYLHERLAPRPAGPQISAAEPAP